MTHATEGMLQAYLDEEVAGAARAEIAEHLEHCSACAAEFGVMRATAAQAGLALAVLDQPAPVASALRQVNARRAAAVQGRRSAWRGSLARAAMLVVMAGGAASAAVPGSPVRAWLSDAWERVTTIFGADRAPHVAEEPALEAPAALETYNAVALAGGRVRIVIAQPAGDATVRVRLVDGTRAALLSTDTGIEVTTASGLLEARGVGAGTITVELPRSAAAATVEVGGVTVVELGGGALRALVPVVTSAPGEIVLRPTR
jgi:anti-sigma factor RsiW